MSYFIFGYDTLMCISSINGRGLKKTYKKKHLYEAKLCGFKRSWNAVWDGKRFLGITNSHHHNINGTIFEINKSDITQLCKSMMVGKVYRFVNVTPGIITNLKLQSDDRVFTYITIKPLNYGTTPSYYSRLMHNILTTYGDDFRNEFIRTTEWNDEFIDTIINSLPQSTLAQ